MKTTNQSIETYFNNLLSPDKIELINPADRKVIDMAIEKTKGPRAYKDFKDSKASREWIQAQPEDIKNIYSNSVFRTNNFLPFVRLIQNSTLFFKTEIPELQEEAQQIIDCIPNYSGMNKQQKFELIAKVESLREKFLVLYRR